RRGRGIDAREPEIGRHEELGLPKAGRLLRAGGTRSGWHRAERNDEARYRREDLPTMVHYRFSICDRVERRLSRLTAVPARGGAWSLYSAGRRLVIRSSSAAASPWFQDWPAANYRRPPDHRASGPM